MLNEFARSLPELARARGFEDCQRLTGHSRAAGFARPQAGPGGLNRASESESIEEQQPRDDAPSCLPANGAKAEAVVKARRNQGEAPNSRDAPLAVLYGRGTSESAGRLGQCRMMIGRRLCNFAMNATI